jgi:hypothetical protein
VRWSSCYAATRSLHLSALVNQQPAPTTAPQSVGGLALAHVNSIRNLAALSNLKQIGEDLVRGRRLVSQVREQGPPPPIQPNQTQCDNPM